jgi:hypothetical protein
MEQSPSWEANSHWASQEVSYLLWNLKVHYRVHKSRSWPLFWIRWIQSTHPYSISLTSIILLSSHLRLGLQCGLFPSGFPAKIFYLFLISPMRATCPPHLIFLDMITLIIFGEAYKLCPRVVTGEKNSPTVARACRKRWLKWVLGAWGYNWATQSPGDINTETWSSRLGVGAQG